jgi:hypothetical protein
MTVARDFAELSKVMVPAKAGTEHYPRGERKGGLVRTFERQARISGANRWDSGSISATSLPMVVV